MSKRRSSPALFELLSEPRPGSAPPTESPKPPATPVKPPTRQDAEPKPKDAEKSSKPTEERPKPSEKAAASAKATDGSKPEVSAATAGDPPKVEPKPAPAAKAPPPGSKLTSTVVAPALAAKPVPEAPVPEAPEPEPRSPEQMPKLVRVNALTISYVATWSLFVLVIGWVAGFQSGQSDAYREWETANDVPTFADTGEVPFDPLLLDEERSLEPDPPRRQESASSSGSAQSSPSVSRTPSTASDAERRTPGLNYLALGVISEREEADRLVRFLQAEGVPAQMVLVRTRGSTAWQVLTLEGITGREYGRNAPVRREHEARISELGRKWRDELRGTLDFTVPERRQWTKYDP